MSADPELPRPYRLDTLGDAPRAVSIAADGGECAALARRFGLIAVERRAAEATLVRQGETVEAHGHLSAAVVQACVATGTALPAVVEAPFALRFVPAADPAAAPAEVELDAADLDVVDYRGGAIDLGEAVAETLALALDPFPRSPDADAALRAAGVLQEGETGPFAGLKTLLADKGLGTKR